MNQTETINESELTRYEIELVALWRKFPPEYHAATLEALRRLYDETAELPRGGVAANTPDSNGSSLDPANWIG